MYQHFNTASTTAPLTAYQTHSVAEHHGHGSSFIDTLLRGFAWRTGSDVTNFLFHLAPVLIVAVVAVALLLFGIRWVRNRNRS